MKISVDPHGWTPRFLGLVTAAASGGVLVLSCWLPSADHGPVVCLFRRITSLPCPSCGMTRAFVALGHGDLHRALGLNIASPAVYLAACCILLLSLAQAAFDRPILPAVWAVVRRPMVPATLALMTAAWSVNLVRFFS
jgi:Protein of unknown function (DUF2752)